MKNIELNIKNLLRLDKHKKNIYFILKKKTKKN